MRKTILMAAIILGTSLQVDAARRYRNSQPAKPVVTRIAEPTFEEWHDLQVNEVNRFKIHTTYFAYENMYKALANDMNK